MEDQERTPVASLREYLSTARESAAVMRWIWREVTTPQSRRFIYWMFVGLTLAIGVQTVQPMAVSRIFNGLSSRHANMIWIGLITFAICVFLQKTADMLQEIAREWVLGLHWVRLDHRITELLFEKSLAQHAHQGSMLSPSTVDKARGRLHGLQNLLLFDGLSSLAQLIFAYLFLFILDWVSGLIMTVVVVVHVSWSLYLNLRVNQVCTPLDRAFRRLNRRRIERWEKVERVKVCGREAAEISEMTDIFGGIIESDRTFWIWFIRHSHARGLINSLGFITIMAWGAWLVWKGSWSIGFLYPLYAWASRVSENIWRVSHIEREVNWNIPSVKAMITALSLPPAIVDPPDAVELDHAVPHRIELRDVSHVYPAEARSRGAENPPALIKVGFTIEPGERVALVGPSGAGKTTVMKKVLRFDDPTSGCILVNGVDLRKVSQNSWHRHIGYIAQQPQVLDGTIRNNLTYKLTEAERASMTDERLWELMKLLQIDFTGRLTQGLDTVVGRNGIKLSGGQAQRLMIGAAVINHPPFLVIDEATSSLYSGTELEVQRGLETVLSTSQTSALIVAHRLSTVRTLCTKFVVLRPPHEVVNGDSQVEAIAGSFEELYPISPTFRRLADCQGVVIHS